MRESQVAVQRLHARGELRAFEPRHAGRIRENGRGILRARRVAGRREAHVLGADLVEQESARARGRAGKRACRDQRAGDHRAQRSNLRISCVSCASLRSA